MAHYRDTNLVPLPIESGPHPDLAAGFDGPQAMHRRLFYLYKLYAAAHAISLTPGDLARIRREIGWDLVLRQAATIAFLQTLESTYFPEAKLTYRVKTGEFQISKQRYVTGQLLDLAPFDAELAVASGHLELYGG